MNLDQNIFEQAHHWATSDEFDEQTRLEIKALLVDQNEKEITDRFYRELEFGTGGMRGIMGAGLARMNVYNIRRATTALALYLQKTFGGETNIKVVLTYDSRHGSKFFAQSACEILAYHGIFSFITEQMRPVPLLSFMVRHFKAHAGICITASHNPKIYNGFKVYWQSGGQLVPPHDRGITQIYNGLTNYKNLNFIPYTTAQERKWITQVGDELDLAYFNQLKKLKFFEHESNKNLKIVYSPLHGTGVYVVPRALALFGLTNVHLVEKQSTPDGDFPTVVSPNPEEPLSLELALNFAKEISADLVLATDPDSDRVGVIVRNGKDWQFFNGNQLGCLLYEYVLSRMQALKILPPKGLTIKTVVTTHLQHEIAQFYGLACEDTLTGFKWICDLVERYETGELKPYKKFVCGGEESYGFLADSFVRDKDAVMACCLVSQMVAYYRHEGFSLSEVLDQIFLRHGLYLENLYTLTLPGKEGTEKIAKMMQTLRLNPPSHFLNVKVESCADFLNIKESQKYTSSPIQLPSTDLLQFFLADKTKISIRPSGTEPKIKIYLSANTTVNIGNLAEKKSVYKKKLDLYQKEVIENLTQT